MTECEREILSVLTRRVRVLSLTQLARTWWTPDLRGMRQAQRTLGSLESSGFAARLNTLAHPEIDLESPVLRWSPEHRAPDFGAAAYRLESRWREQPVPVTLVYATSAATRLLGGCIRDRPPRPSETTHDVHVAALYLLVRRRDRRAARAWVGEHELSTLGFGKQTRLPDAMLLRSRGHRGDNLVMEFGGRYSKAKLVGFHEWCAANVLAYELW